jgi:hypothetical protein
MRTYRPQLLLLALVAGFSISACAGDPNTEPDPTDTADASDASDALDGGLCYEGDAPEDGEPCDCEGETFEGQVELCDRTCACEFGFWVCEDECEEPPELELVISETLDVEEVTGNGDAIVNPGEVWSITGTVAANNAGEDGVEASVRLAVDSIFVDVDAASAQFAALGDDPEEFTLEFEVLFSATESTVNVTVEAFSGFASSSRVVEVDIVPAQVPVFTLGTLDIVDSEGEPYGAIAPGDTVYLRGTASNTGPVDASDVTVTTTSSNALVQVPEPFSAGALASGASDEIMVELVVSDDPTALSTEVYVELTAPDADPASRTRVIDVVPADTIELVGTEWEAGGSASEWTLVVTVRNTGSFELTGVTWLHIDGSIEIPEDLKDDFPTLDCFDPIEEPDPDNPPTCYDPMGFEDPEGPTALAGGVEGEVRLALTTDESTPDPGLLVIRARSDARSSHGPIRLEVAAP